MERALDYLTAKLREGGTKHYYGERPDYYGKIKDNGLQLMGEAVLIDYAELEELEAVDAYVALKPYDIILCTIEDVVLWKKQFYPVIVSIITSLVFLLVWVFDPSMITLISAAGIVCVAIDCIARTSFVDSLRNNVNRTECDGQFRGICLKLVRMRHISKRIYQQLSENRQREPNKHFFYCFAFFASLAWIGCRVHNLLLLYIVVSFIALLPGFRRSRVTSKYYAAFVSLICHWSLKPKKS
ncbi:ADP-ribosylation factor-like protein 6-interacting protein 1 [Convolutriloba macropyga]|uniref:ADP-ribosylation factor-like protein 6-interacting protein 1 n=1 Tax=Convolutriloba macropyga TaxID=536237 RepID=UPI003F524637